MGGTGGVGGDVALTSKGGVRTRGERAYGLLAQSIGSGGGNSGSISLSAGTPANKEKKTVDLGLSVAVGLDGGVGGAGGDVVLNAEGVVSTLGRDAHAVFAQSIGGGGGTGGSAGGLGFITSSAAAVAVGGRGGVGGVGGAVTVSSAATVGTSGGGAIGILAQSVGGGGGTGGSSGGSIPSIRSNTSSVRIAVGGFGGEGMDGGAVTVTNDGRVTTLGEGSHGVLAQSVGGGGGDGGMAFNEVLYEGGGDDPRAHVKVGVGGIGGTGGDGGKVQVTNRGAVDTLGKNAVGLLAQSVGGGGGNGGTAIDGSLMGVAGNNVNVSVGGIGGLGGVGGEVVVKNLKNSAGSDAGIFTRGEDAYGILAMSVGGGGGRGGAAVTNSTAGTSTPGGKTVFTVDVSVGGAGGIGGLGGKATVENDGNITTYGKGAHGIIAESVGGGGGNGGLAVSGDLSLGATAVKGAKQHVSTIALGGVGGFGNDGGEVAVKNSGNITVEGDQAYGVYAQSVGGGGGNGGFAVALSRNLLTNPFQLGALEGALFNIGVGGVGGFGGSGGQVTVEHTGNIVANGDNAYGIFAQSVAGGGGTMSYSLSSPVWMAAGLGIDLGLGAVRDVLDEATDTSAPVTLTSTGNITVTGANSRATLAQTVHGGGGNVNLFLDVSQKAVEIGEDGIERPPSDPGIDGILGRLLAPIEVGAKLAWKEAGGDLLVEQAGNFLVGGSLTAAALYQSVGGGGGSTTVVNTIAQGTKLGLDLLAGAEETLGSPGGLVKARREGSIYTTNEMAQGAGYQSIGGGGGQIFVNVRTVPAAGADPAAPARAAAAADPAVTATIAIGAVASTGNHGGEVDVTNAGDTLTLGHHSPGLVLQSIGAGGGDVHLFGLEALGVTLGGQGGSSGDGGAVSFSNVGAVATDGDRSHGLVLQSIGGGGGALFTDLAPAAVTITLSSGGSGDGGDVELTQDGLVQVLGRGAYGVAAQSIGGGGGLVDTLFAGSAGGSGHGGNVTVHLTDSVLATGDGSTAVFAQSAGGPGAENGDITVTLDGPLVEGGRGGAGVRLDGGRANALVNHGVLRTRDGTAGAAILGTAGSDRVENHGTVIGRVELGGGANAFVNRPGGVLLSGGVCDLGPEGLLENAGDLAPGGAGVLQAVALTGGFRQTDAGVLHVDLDFAGNRTDRIDATGAGEVDGRVVLTTRNPQSLRPGVHDLALVAGAAGVVDRGAELVVAASAVVDYRLGVPAPDRFTLRLGIDFSPAGLDRNRAAIGDWFNALQLAGGSPAMAPVVVDLFGHPDVASLAATYDVMNPDYYDHFTATTVGTVRGFADAQRRRLGATGAEGGSGVWLERFGGQGRQRADGGFDGYKHDALGGAFGLDRRLGDRGLAGLGLGYSRADLELDGAMGDGLIRSVFASAYGGYGGGTGLYLNGAVAYGSHTYDNGRFTRVLSVARHASSSHRGYSWSAHGEAGGRLGTPEWRVHPFLALDYVYLREDAVQESGADVLSLRVEPRTTDSLTSDLGLRLARRFALRGGAVEAGLSGSWSYDFGIDDRRLSAGFAGAPGPTFSITGREPSRHGFLVGAGLRVADDAGVGFTLRADREWRRHAEATSVLGQVDYRF